MSTQRPIVVLTGASAGIGLSALEALRNDAYVIAVSRTKPPVLEANIHWLSGDLRKPEWVASQILDIVADQPIDGLIHCAVSYGANGRHPFLDTLDPEWDDVMAVNARSQFVLTSRLLPRLLRRPQAFIVAVSSDVATRPAPERIAYGCSKAASYALFSGLAAELSGSSVAVIQMLPERQVVTRGLRGRRPPGFDFAGYSSPDIFKEPFRSVLRCRGRGMNGKWWVVGDEE